MITNSAIQWTTHTFNPWWGCQKVAQGCTHCYAEGVAERFYGRRIWGPNSERKIASEKVWNDPARWNRAAAESGERAKVFCLSMGDVLEDHPALVEPRKRLVGIVEATPWLDWQLLTKRPENAAMLGWGQWPAHVWFGASAAIQPELNTVMPWLFRAGAAVRFLSLEPLVGPMDFAQVPDEWDRPEQTGVSPALLGDLDWVIVGGESGPQARACHIEWLRSIVTQCRGVGVPCFVKQLGRWIAGPHDFDGWQGKIDRWLLSNGKGDSATYHRPIIRAEYSPQFYDERPKNAVAWGLGDLKGGEMSSWPEDLRVREFPTVVGVTR